MEQDKINAYMTLYEALVTVSKVAAPMTPFMTEQIYQNLVRSIDKHAPESIHLCDYPTCNEEQIDKMLEYNMNQVLNIVVMGRACRNAANIKNRQPIGNMYVKTESKLSKYYQDIIREELNVKELTFKQDVSMYTSYSFKPQLKTVGPKYGKLLGGIKAALETIDGNKGMKELLETGCIKLLIGDEEVTLLEEDLLIENARTEGYIAESDAGVTVVLDTSLSKELIEEGFVREIISKVQTMRKEAGFEVMDQIHISYEGSSHGVAVFERNENEIAKETLSLQVAQGNPEGFVKEWDINGENLTIGVKKHTK
jgi:Isoleucyl-tRNA synthetase